MKKRASAEISVGACPLPLRQYDTVQLSHGSGGKLSHDLITELFLRHFGNPLLDKLEDQATIPPASGRLSFTTDSFVVDPIFFPGGNIGELAVYGTVNDLCMNGARPLYLSAAFIIEEGLPLKVLERIVVSMREAADRAKVMIVTGDTKVVNRGQADKLFINTAGIGLIEHSLELGARRIVAGDKLVCSGSIANHGMAVLSQREGLAFSSPIVSDSAPLCPLVEILVEIAGESLHAMRDPTRGGVGATLNEFASAAGVGITVFEEMLQVEPAVRGACELLGLDPLYVANEGVLIAAIAADAADVCVSALRRHPLGQKAAVIGEAGAAHPGLVTVRTRFGTERILDLPVGEQLPRIC